MKLTSRLLSLSVVLVVGASCLVSCQTYRTRKVVFKNHPIALYVVNEVVDEETIEYSAKFRNVGREILSFDYTIADEEGLVVSVHACSASAANETVTVSSLPMGAKESRGRRTPQ